MSITNPFVSANATFNPGQYAVNPEEEGQYQDTSLSAGGSPVVNPLANLSQMLGGSNLSNPSVDGGIGATSNIFNNPNQGQLGPVVGRQGVDYTPPTSQPVYNPNTGTSRTISEPDWTGFRPGEGPTGWEPGNDWEKSLSSFRPSDGGTQWNSSPSGLDTLDGISNMFSGSTPSWSTPGFSDLDFGVSFNPGALDKLGGGWREGGRVFDFGDKSLGQGIAQGLGISKDAYNTGRQALGMFGQFTGNRDSRELLGISGLTGNRAFDMATKGTALEYINNPLSERSLIGTALNTQGLGGLMPGLDYLQGFNSRGGLLGAGISMVNPLAGGIFNFLSPELGGKVTTQEELTNYNPKYNENLGGEGQFNVGSYEAAANYAQSHGVTPDTHEFDMVVDSYRNAIRTNPSFDPMGANRATVAAEKQASVEVERQAEVARVAEQQRQAEAQRVEAAEFKRASEQAAAERQAAAQRVAAEQQRQAEAARQAQAQQEKEAMQSAGNYSAWDDSGGWNDSAFDSGGNYSDWGSSESFEDDQGGSDWW